MKKKKFELECTKRLGTSNGDMLYREDDDGVVLVKTVLEGLAFDFGSAHQCWGLLAMEGGHAFTGFGVDFVIVVDVSASMNVEGKLQAVKDAIGYMLGGLRSRHRVALISFNHNVSVESELVYCTKDNCENVIEILGNIEASGSTNISEALFTATSILENRNDEMNRISSILLITDGLSNRGMSSEETISTLTEIPLPDGCICNTFGFGEEHDSKLLHAIALKTQGMYYYIPHPKNIQPIIEGSIKDILNTVCQNTTVELIAQDGARIIAFHVPLAISERKRAKHYLINVGLLSSGQSKSILFRLSLRKMKHAMKQPLLHAIIRYEDIFGNINTTEKWIKVDRTTHTDIQNMPPLLEENIYRFSTAKAITEAIELSYQMRFTEARAKLEALLHTFRESGHSSVYTPLIHNICQCIQAMRDVNTFATGIHEAHAFSSIYFMEKNESSEHSLYLSNIEDGYLNDDYQL